MNAVEFTIELDGGSALPLPSDIASKLPKSGTARVVVLTDDLLAIPIDIPGALVDRKILELGLEDTTGLYAIVWRLNALYPQAEIASKYDVADKRCRALLQAGHIRLVRHFLRQNSRLELSSTLMRIDC